MKKINFKIVTPIVVGIMAMLLIVGEVYAWFAISNKADTGGVETGVIGSENNLTVGWQGSAERTAKILPGNYLIAELFCENNTSTAGTFRVSLESCTVGYPTLTDNAAWRARILTDDYYVNGLRTEIAPTSPTEFFKDYIRPVTNALRCAVFTAMPTKSTENLSEHLTSAAAPADLSVTDVFTLNSVLPINGDGVNANGEITLASGAKQTLYMLFYFDPTVYVTVNGTQLRNSNAYVAQNLTVVLNLEKTSV